MFKSNKQAELIMTVLIVKTKCIIILKIKSSNVYILLKTFANFHIFWIIYKYLRPLTVFVFIKRCTSSSDLVLSELKLNRQKFYINTICIMTLKPIPHISLVRWKPWTWSSTHYLSCVGLSTDISKDISKLVRTWL